jgi:hypothetical protein
VSLERKSAAASHDERCTDCRVTLTRLGGVLQVGAQQPHCPDDYICEVTEATAADGTQVTHLDEQSASMMYVSMLHL